MRKDPKLGEMPNLSDINFRPRTVGPATNPVERSQTWQIAIGVFLGLTMFFVAYKIHEYMEIRAALKILEQEMENLAKPDAGPYGWQRQATIDQQRKEARERQLYELKPGERCIEGRRFRRIENGWVQINRPCR